MGRPIFEARHFNAVAREIRKLGADLQESGRRFGMEKISAWEAVAIVGLYFAGLFERNNPRFDREYFLEESDILPEVRQYQAEETAREAGQEIGARIAGDLLSLAEKNTFRFRKEYAGALYESGEISGADRDILTDADVEELERSGATHLGRPVSESEFVSVALQVEERRRQFSPFDHLASEINRAPEPHAWDEYDSAVCEAVRKRFRDYCRHTAGNLNVEESC